MIKFWCGIFVTFCIISLSSAENGDQTSPTDVSTAAELLSKIYTECASISCAKPKILSFISTSMNKDKIRITRDLAIVRSNEATVPANDDSDDLYKQQVSQLSEDKKEALRSLMLDRLDDFIANHEIRMRVPREIISDSVSKFVPEFLMRNIPSEIKLPLAEAHVGQERGFVKKVIVPFLLGLKFKATALLPLALALIALKTWKALTLGLLSLVLSGALVMFRFASKPKILSYEVVHHSPPIIHSPPIVPHYLEHPHDHPHEHFVHEHHGPYKRSVHSRR